MCWVDIVSSTGCIPMCVIPVSVNEFNVKRGVSHFDLVAVAFFVVVVPYKGCRTGF